MDILSGTEALSLHPLGVCCLNCCPLSEGDGTFVQYREKGHGEPLMDRDPSLADAIANCFGARLESGRAPARSSPVENILPIQEQ